MGKHAEMAASLTREKLTVEQIKQEADDVKPSNDNLLQMGEERFQLRLRVSEMTRMKFWEKELEVNGSKPSVDVLWTIALQCLPYLTHVQDGHKVPKTKSAALKVIGRYLKFAKMVTKQIDQMRHGKDPNDELFVHKRDRLFSQNDLLECMGFVRVMDLSDSLNKQIESAGSVCLSSFDKVEEHYSSIISDDVTSVSSDSVGGAAEPIADSENGDASNDDCQVRRSSRRRRPNSRFSFPGEESSSDEESDEEDEADNDRVPLV